MGGRHSKETKSYYVEYGASSQLGGRPKQEDRFSADLMYADDQAKSFFGVYDGHFGHDAAEFCRDQLPKEIARSDNLSADPISAVKGAYARVDERLLQRAAKKRDRSGCTAITVMLVNRLLIVAHVGDCRLLVNRGNRMFQVTRDHVPTRKSERRRIRRNGGTIVNGLVQGRLAVSRALGDLPYKVGVEDVDSRMLTSEPDVIVTKVDALVQYLLLASDGLFERLSPGEIQQFVESARTHQRLNLMQTSDALARLAVERGAQDNITVILIGFEHKDDASSSDGATRVSVQTGALRREEILVDDASSLAEAVDVTDSTSNTQGASSVDSEDVSFIPENFRNEPLYE